jgi:hypothetical protein
VALLPGPLLLFAVLTTAEANATMGLTLARAFVLAKRSRAVVLAEKISERCGTL